MLKATAQAHAIQGLLKYHGLRDRRKRIPFHDSISVCVEKLTTTTTIEFNPSYDSDQIEINEIRANPREASRVSAVVEPLLRLSKSKSHFRLISRNSLTQGKGLGFSAAAFASIALAASKALHLDLDLEKLSETARLGAGSASRSVVGGFSIWYANRNHRSFARQLASRDKIGLGMVVVPIASNVKTDMAHEESLASPFFHARLSEVEHVLPKMLRAIKKGDIDQIGRLTEAESLSLHAVTMTGGNRLLLMSPETVRLIRLVESMREADRLSAWYSLDTGPSVYINTYLDSVEKVRQAVENDTGIKAISSGVGGPARIVNEHLF